MAVQIKFDEQNNVIQPAFLLANRRGDIYDSIPYSKLHISDNLTDSFELVFFANKYRDGVKYRMWEQLQDFKLAYCSEWDVWFQLSVKTMEENETQKYISAKALGESELSQIMLYDVEINTETDILREDYIPSILFDEKNPKASILHRIMEKAPHYTIKHVDASIAKLQRTFAINAKSIHQTFQEIAKEVNCIFIINSGMGENGRPAREVSVYDLESYCPKCEKRGEFLDACPQCGNTNIKMGYGEDTHIFVSKDNLAENIEYAADVDSVKNCFKLEAGDDLMTAAIVSCNPNGSSYIWYFSEQTKQDMSKELSDAINAYDQKYAYYQNDFVYKPDAAMRTAYNALINKYKTYRSELETIPESIVGYAALMNAYYDTIDMNLFLHDELMPSVEMQDTTAAKQAALLDSTALSPVAVTNLATCSESTAKSAVLAMAKTVIDPRYRVKVVTSSYSNNVWSGSFSVTNYSDEEDAAESATIRVSVNDDYVTYIKQKLTKSVTGGADNPTDISGLFALEIDAFKAELKKYSLTRLQSYADTCQGCMDILIEQGIADDQTWVEAQENLYNDIYAPYYNKLKALEAEIKVRETEIETVVGKYDSDGFLVSHGLQTMIQDQNNQIHDALNFEKCLGTDLWLEFIAYRREDTYSNPNFISDGLTNREIFTFAREFFEVAQKEIFKSATMQHSVSSTLKNLLAMKEFKPIVKYFKVGNWLRLCVDEKLFRLRLLSYDIDFENLKTLPVVFSDVTRTIGGTTDSQSMLEQAASMATSYDSIKRQANQGTRAKRTLDGWVDDSLALTQVKIVNSADNQNISWDKHGFLCREHLPITDSYDDKQLKIINRGMYLTDDNWKTSRTGVGDFEYYDPADGQMKETYGVIADTLVGNLILSKKVGIYNMNNSIVLDENGVVITTNGENVPGTQKVFTIRKKNADANGVETLENLMYVDNNGNLHFKGTLHGTTGEFTGSVHATELYIADMIEARDNTVTIKAACALNLSGGDITMNGSKAINIASTGGLNITGSDVVIKGKNLSLLTESSRKGTIVLGSSANTLTSDGILSLASGNILLDGKNNTVTVGNGNGTVNIGTSGAGIINIGTNGTSTINLATYQVKSSTNNATFSASYATGTETGASEDLSFTYTGVDTDNVQGSTTLDVTVHYTSVSTSSASIPSITNGKLLQIVYPASGSTYGCGLNIYSSSDGGKTILTPSVSEGHLLGWGVISGNQIAATNVSADTIYADAMYLGNSAVANQKWTIDTIHHILNDNDVIASIKWTADKAYNKAYNHTHSFSQITTGGSGGSSGRVSTITLPIVTSFTQASGDPKDDIGFVAPTTEYTLLYSTIGVEVPWNVPMGEEEIWSW